MKNKRNGKYIVLVILLLVLIAGVLLCALNMKKSSSKTDNLARMRGIKVTCDSVESDKFAAKNIVDGNVNGTESRWSSENNWEDATHYIQLEFPEEVFVDYVVLYWERLNVCDYSLEASRDGVQYEMLQEFHSVPHTNRQEIVLEKPVAARFLRLTSYDVTRNEEDASLYYQNMSLYEIEVYEKAPVAYRLEAPVLLAKEDGSRYIESPKAPEGYQVTWIGADLEQVVGEDGKVYDTYQDKTVLVGYQVEDLSGKEPVREASFEMMIPANQGTMVEEKEANPTPKVVPAVAEWAGGKGFYSPTEKTRLIIDAELFDTFEPIVKEVLEDVNFLSFLVEEATSWNGAMLPESMRDSIYDMFLVKGTESDLQEGDIFFTKCLEECGLGEEGYQVDITDRCYVKAQSITGLRYGLTTLVQILMREKGQLPCGVIRDYPLYKVRGFGIDVARKAVSMDTLYEMVREMSYYKMNDLEIHLNDNTILSTSGMTDTAEHAMEAESAFRLESAVKNTLGEPLTSSEYAYTKEEFAAFVEMAKAYGVTVVPEIDTPAHSLALTKLFPEYALRTRNESVDQIDLGKKEAVSLVKSIWEEMLQGDKAPFADAKIINIGMDEYYGDGEQFRQYMKDISEQVAGAGKMVRMWGSLSNVDGQTLPDAKNLQMNLWSSEWAYPQDMYDLGFGLINMQSNHLYIIPGGGYDYLDLRELWTNWEVNKYYDTKDTSVVPSYSPQILGAAYMIWNDMSGNLDLGISENDLYDRFEQPLALLSTKLWTKPDTKEESENNVTISDMVPVDKDIPALWITKKDLDGVGNQKSFGLEELKALSAKGLKGLAPYYKIGFAITLPENSSGSEVIAKALAPYGEWALYAVEPESGRVGFQREGKTYVFDYTLPKGEKVNLTIVGDQGTTSLYVNDVLIETLGTPNAFEEYATFVFPVEQLGKETGCFTGSIESIEQ